MGGGSSKSSSIRENAPPFQKHLLSAIACGGPEVVEYLVNNYDVDVNKSYKGSYPLVEAVRNGRWKIALILLNKGATGPLCYTQEDDYGEIVRISLWDNGGLSPDSKYAMDDILGAGDHIKKDYLKVREIFSKNGWDIPSINCKGNVTVPFRTNIACKPSLLKEITDAMDKNTGPNEPSFGRRKRTTNKPSKKFVSSSMSYLSKLK
jgi:hypothetical protein